MRARSMRVIVSAAVLVAAAASCGGGGRDQDDGARPGAAVVREVTDGDTVRVRVRGVDERVRLLGIDTPETHGPGGLRECFGAEATRQLRKLIPEGTRIILVRDVEARDRYGRLLAYLYRDEDDLFVNLAMVRDGYAAVLTYSPNVAHQTEFVSAAREAREANRGLWSACGGADTPITASSRQ